MARTAVSWLIELIEDHCIRIDEKIIEKAKQKEKEQIEEAYNEGFIDSYDNIDNVDIYYNKRYTNGL